MDENKHYYEKLEHFEYMILGKTVYLTAVEKKDLPQLMIWRNKEELRKYFREYREINEDMQNKWFEEKVLNDFSTIMFSI